MTTADAKKVLEMLSRGEDRILKENVFEIIDMIDQPSTISIPCYPIIPNAPCPNTEPWKVPWTCMAGAGTECSLKGTGEDE